MNWRTQLSLLALVAGLLGVLWLTSEKADDKGSVSVSLLSSHRIGTAVRMQWQFVDEEPIEVRRQPGGPFRLVHPLEDLLAQDHLVNVANTFDSAMIGETPFPDDAENRARTGLDHPRLVLDIDFEDGAREHIEIGSEGPLGNDLFVRRNGQIYRGGLALYTALHKGLDDLRERQIFSTASGAVSEVVVDRALPSSAREVMKLVRRGDGWRLTEPFEAPAAASAANSFVGNILAMRIDTFVSGPIRLPDGPPDVILTLRGGAQDEQLKLWRDTQENLFGRLDSRRISFKASNQQAQRIFEETAGELRTRVLIPVQDLYRDVLTLMVDAGEPAPRLVLVREAADSAWRFQEPFQGYVEPQAANELLTAINNLRALAFLPRGSAPSEFGLGPGALQLSISTSADLDPHRLRMGKSGKTEGMEVAYVSLAGEPEEIYAVPKGAVDVIRRPWTDYVQRTIFTIREPVTKVALSRRGGGTRQLAVDAAGKWGSDSGAAVDDDRVADIVDRIRDLACKRVRLAKDAGLGEPDWSIALGRNQDPMDGGFGALEVWDEPGRPLLVRNRNGVAGVLYELAPIESDGLRQLWN